ncbi:MAG TPA: hypothetical protein VKY31_03620 [Terriglobia bacterium]|nr:hypothetical protein [Terriglobia bacterium]
MAILSGFASAQSPDIILGRILGNSKVKEAQEHIQKNGGVASDAGDVLRGAVVDERKNRVIVRAGSQPDSLVAVVYAADSPESVGAVATILQTLDAVDILTKKSLIFVGTSKTDDAVEENDNLRSFLEKDAHHGRVTACVFVQPAAEGSVYGPPNSIGSTIVQYGLQSAGIYLREPDYKPAVGSMAVPIELRIPTVGVGIGEGRPTVKGVESAITALLAIAGV